MDINKQLHDLYQSHWSHFRSFTQALQKPVFTNPLLLSVDENAYNEADLKIMICLNENISYLQASTSFEETITRSLSFLQNSYTTVSLPQAISFYQDQLSLSFPEKKIHYTFQNIFKIGRSDAQVGTTSQIRNIEASYFPVFLDELKILRPDIILFFTGPTNDFDVKYKIPATEFTPAKADLDIKTLALLKSEHLPQKTLRSYHPAHFWHYNKKVKEAILHFLKKWA